VWAIVHEFAGCYRDTLAFFADIGAVDGLRIQPQLDVPMIDRSGRRSRLTCPVLPPPFNVVAGVLEWNALAWSDRVAVLRMLTPLRNARRQLGGAGGRIAASPDETVENWLVRNGQTGPLCEMLWNPLALATLNQPPERAAAPVFARVLAEMFGTDATASGVALPTAPLHLLYAEPARRYIEQRGGSVRTGAPATVRVAGEATLFVSSGSDRFTAGSVVAAVPWFRVGALFDGEAGALREILDRASAMEPSPIVSVNLWFNRPIVGEPFVGLPGRPMQWVFERPGSAAGAFHLSLIASGASALVERTNEELVAQALGELVEALPITRSAALLGSSVVREPRATFSLAAAQPRRPGTRTPVRRLYLAGDWIDTGLPATIEGAVRSGYLAADACLRP
jgi:zeta-carotene desaturase